MKTILFLSLLLVVLGRLDAARLSTEANRMAELSFESGKSYADSFNEVMLDAVFTTPEGRLLGVPAFWAGGKTWRLRYASAIAGKHTFRTECSDMANTALHGVMGDVFVTPYSLHLARIRRARAIGCSCWR